MEQIINILSGHNDTNAILERMESLIKAGESVFSSDSSSSSSCSSYESTTDEEKDDHMAFPEQEMSLSDLAQNSCKLAQQQQQQDVKPLIGVPSIIDSDPPFDEQNPKRPKIENSVEYLELVPNLLQVEESVDFTNIIDKYSPEEFKANMRVNQSTVQYLIDGFSSSEHLPCCSNGGRMGVSGKKCVYMYIWYMGNSVTFTHLATMFQQCKSTAWTCVKRVSSWLISIGFDKIKWPKGSDQVKRVQNKFQNMHTIPGVVGVIGCTRIIIRPPKEKEKYLDSHQNCSLALQAVVDAEQRFLDVTCNEPGSLDDYSVFKKSGLFLQASGNDEDLFPDDTFILGNSSYPASRWLVTPFVKYDYLSDSQIRFNYMHCVARNTVYNSFRHLKTRFRKLQKFTDVSNMTTLTNLINGACVLHNICLEQNDAYEFGQDVGEYNNQYEIEPEVCNNRFVEDTNRRDILFNNMYQKNII